MGASLSARLEKCLDGVMSGNPSRVAAGFFAALTGELSTKPWPAEPRGVSPETDLEVDLWGTYIHVPVAVSNLNGFPALKNCQIDTADTTIGLVGELLDRKVDRSWTMITGHASSLLGSNFRRSPTIGRIIGSVTKEIICIQLTMAPVPTEP